MAKPTRSEQVVHGVLGGSVIATVLAVPAAISLTALLPAPVAEAKPTGGNTVVYSTTPPYTATHTFTSDGTFVVPAGAHPLVSYALIGGGGAGGSFVTGPLQAAAGGGGAGGMLAATDLLVTSGSYPVTVGAGGVGGTGTSPSTRGADSSWNGLTGTGGGQGASVNSTDDLPGSGGSGGGARCGLTPNAGGTGTAGQGTGGGANAAACTGAGANDAGSGGGGSSGAGGVPVSPTSGNGGAGKVVPWDSFGLFYGYGGSGGANGTITASGSGAPGGTGKGATSSVAATAGLAGRGNGGGGGNAAHPTGGNGGSGVVRLRYLVGFLTYHANTGAGTAPANSDYIAAGETTPVAAPTGLSKTGYYFTGWNTEATPTTATPGTAFAPGDPYAALTRTTLFAQWKLVDYTVAFDNNSGTGSMAAQAYTYGTPQKLTANTFTRTGYDFTGWNTKADGTGTAYTDQQEVTDLTETNGATVTLYAQWAPHHYTVSYVGNGGARSMPGQAFTYGTPQRLAANTYARSGFTFAGWNTAANGSGTSYADKAVVNNLTPVDGATVILYAQWKADPQQLPNTGGPSLWWLLAGLVLTVAGGLTLVARRVTSGRAVRL